MKEEEIYIKGYKEGFESALKVAWGCALETLIAVDNPAKEHVKALIDKLKA